MRMKLETGELSVVLPRLRGTARKPGRCLFLPYPDNHVSTHHLACPVFSYQTFSKSGQGRISGPQQHVAVSRSEESLQKGKVLFTLSAHERYTGPQPKDTVPGPNTIPDVEITCLSNGSN